MNRPIIFFPWAKQRGRRSAAENEDADITEDAEGRKEGRKEEDRQNESALSVQRSAKGLFLGCMTRPWQRERVTQPRKIILAGLCITADRRTDFMSMHTCPRHAGYGRGRLLSRLTLSKVSCTKFFLTTKVF